MVQRDVDRGRDAWNVSEGEAEDEADDAIELIESDAMPPFPYPLAHPDARLDDEERAALIAALQQLDEGDGGDDDSSGPDDGGDDDRSSSGPG